MAETAVPSTLDSALALLMERFDNRPGAALNNAKSTYLTAYKSFLRWYYNNVNDTTMALTTEEGSKGTVYATQENADKFYLHHVPENITGTFANAKRYYLAIDWFRMFVEKPEGPPLVLSSIISTSLKQQQEVSLARSGESYAGVDPHRGLRGIMAEENNVTIVKYIWQQRQDFADLLFGYTWGRNAACRGHSARKFQLSDLNIAYAYGPENVAPRNRTLLLVLRKGGRGKEKSTTDKQIGVYRHRDYRQCAVFATGVLLIKLLRRIGDSIQFTQPTQKQDCNWWGIVLSRFATLNVQSDAMKEVYRSTGINPNGKITHHRSQSVLLGGSKGLDNNQISTFTKHIQDKLHSSYMPDCEKKALKVMSGFEIVSIVCFVRFIYIYLSNFIFT